MLFSMVLTPFAKKGEEDKNVARRALYDRLDGSMSMGR